MAKIKSNTERHTITNRAYATSKKKDESWNSLAPRLIQTPCLAIIIHASETERESHAGGVYAFYLFLTFCPLEKFT